MRRIVQGGLAAALISAALGVTAGEQPAPMTAEEFERYVTGRTLTYAESGQIYGIEQYLPSRRVRWAFAGDACQDGIWYAEGPLICFVYEAEPEPQCWSFFLAPGGGLNARFENGDGALTLYEARNADAPLYCPGPGVGV